MNLADVTARARAILKGLKETKEDDKTTKMPKPPADPDGMEPDSRVGDASPTDEDMDDAKAAAPAQEADGDAGGDAPAGADDGGEFDDDDDDDEDDARPVKKGFDEFGNADIDLRELMKAYGDTTNPPEPEQVAKGGDDLAAILTEILNALQDKDAVMSELKAEVKRLQAGMGEHERTLAKALAAMGDPRLAPALNAPKAITKSFPEAPAAPEGPSLADRIFAEGRAGRMSPDQAMALCRQERGGE